MADPFEKLSKPAADPFAKLSGPPPAATPADPFARLSEPQPPSVDREVPEVIPEQELEQLAKKYNVDKEFLRESAPFLLTNVERKGLTDFLKATGKYATGTLLDAIGFGLPQKIRIQSEEDPNKQQALQELRELGEEQRGLLNQIALGVVTPGLIANIAKGTGTAAKIVKPLAETATGRLATVAGAGALSGVGYAPPGEEVKGAAIGAALGAGLGVAGETVAKILSKRGQKALTEAEQAALKSLNIDEMEQKAAKELQEEGNILVDDLLFGKRTIEDLTEDQVNSIISKNLDKDTLKTYMSLDTEEGKRLFKRTDKELISSLGKDQALSRTLAKDIIDAEKRDFVNFMTDAEFTNKPLVNRGWDKLLRQGKDFVEQEYKQFRVGKTINKYIEDAATFDIKPESKIGRVMSKLSDARFTLRTIDEKFTTPTEMVLDELSKSRNLMGTVREAHKKSLDNIMKLADERGTVDAVRSGKIYRALDTGNMQGLTQPEIITANRITQEFKDLYKFITDTAREKGIKTLDIPQIENYVHRVSMPVPETIARVEMELNNSVAQANKLLQKNYTDLSQVNKEDLAKLIEQSPALNNLRQYINWVRGTEFEFKTGSELAAAIRQSIRSEQDIQLLDKVARGSMERTATMEGIPEFIREKNVFKVLDRYSQDMLSNLYQREPLSKLNFYADRIDKLGGTSEAQYIRNIVEDTLGVRKGTVAHFMRDARAEIARKLDPLIDKAVKEGDTNKAFILNSVKEMEQAPGFLASQIYPNVLGWRPVPVIQNLISGIARTAPELGTKYGYTTYVRGLVHTMTNLPSLVREVRATGLVPESFTRTGQRAIADGIRASRAVDTGLKGLDALSRLGMSLYELSENINRATILSMSRMMTYDLTRGSKLAKNALTKFPSSVQRAVARAGNDPKAVESIIATHLNGATAFNYNRPSLYEFGRTMGPMFATFAKWPTAIAGEMASEIRTKGLPRGLARSAERYAAPLIALGVVDYFLQDRLEESERTQALIGKTGFKKAAPISSLGGFVAGDIFTPPMVDTIMQDIVVPATKAEGVKLVRGLDRTAFMYTPGAGFIKFLTDFIPTVITGERPEGSTQTERTLRSTGIVK